MQVLGRKKRFEAVDEHFQAVEGKMDYAHEQARERFERIEERLAKLGEGRGGAGPRGGGGDEQPQEVVFGNFAGEELAEEVINKVRPLLASKGLLTSATEIYARSRRPTVLFLRLADPTTVTRTATRLRQARIEVDGWANRDRSKEERVRVTPVGSMIAQLRQARELLPESRRGEKDAEGGWRRREEEVRLTTNQWKSRFVVGKMVDGEWQEVPEENLRSAMGCEWFARLGEVRAMEAGN